MQSKLTLVLDKEVVEQAKKYAERQGRSLSRLVENYFSVLTKSPARDKEGLPPQVRALSGAIKFPPKWDWRKDRETYLSGKYR